MDSEYVVKGLVTLDTLLDNLNDLPTVETYEAIKGTFYKRKIIYYDIPAAFDTEASSFYYNMCKAACMYIWQIGINGMVIVGRTWEEYNEAIEQISNKLNLSYTKRLIIYVHNLAYDFQWIKDRHKWIEIFAREKRSPLKALTGGIEFRCSYMLSGKSLEKTCEDLNKYKVEKLVGDLDYDLIRTPITPLTNKEMGYCINDIVGVMNYIQEQIEFYGDITNVPLTNTGRVRKYCRNVCFNNENKAMYKKLMSELQIGSVQELEMLKRAFMGGYTHANYHHVSDICENVGSHDFTSSYPAQLVCSTYPMGAGEWIKVTDIKQIEKMSSMYYVIFNIEIEGISEKPGVPDNYISYSKCFDVKNEKLNNGRVISADHLQMTISSDDWDIIKATYDCKSVKIGRAIRYVLKYLPRCFVECILESYKDKTTLKDVVEERVNYMMKKIYVNIYYGMTVTAVDNDDVYYDEMYDRNEWDSKKCNVKKTIEEYNASKNRFLFFPWGVRCTSLARKALWFGGILKLGQDYIYSDTDSVKYMNPEKNAHIFEEYNEQINKKMEIACKINKLNFEYTRPKTIKGIEKPLGVWDNECIGKDGKPHYYKRFKTLGAKRYMYEDSEGKLHVTIAGVNKDDTAKFLTKQQKEKNIDPFEFFDNEMTISEEYSGRKIHTYIDHPYEFECTDYMGNYYSGKELSGIHIEKSDYNLTMTPAFMDLLGSVEKSYFF